MQRQLEAELKWALTAQAHAALAERLGAELGPPLRLEQENRFYDSPDLRLRRAGMNLRLRRENVRWVLTAKRKAPGGGGGLHTHDEWELALDPAQAGDPATWPLPEPLQTALAGSPVAPQGGFANLRLEWHLGPDLLCLDATDYGQRLDHELEIETAEPHPAAARWGARLRAWGIAWRPEPRTKFARWLELAEKTRR